MITLAHIKRTPVLFLLLLFIGTLAKAQISGAEYFWDTDPGTGQGYTITPENNDFNNVLQHLFEGTIIYPEEQGTHTFNIRLRDECEEWGPVYQRKILIIDESPSLSITAAEYFWDTDPGNGTATPILALDGDFNQAIETALSSSIKLPEQGQHTFNIRVQDFDGNWGPVYERKILIVDENPSLSITAAEYFWDTDPGNGSATPILALDGDFNQAIETALSSSIELPEHGQHTFNIRVQDFDGHWGPIYERKILIIDENPSLSITAAEYFWDTDPGNGSATPILAFDGDFNQAIETALSSSIELPEHGQHTFSIRVQDFDGHWGPIYERKILIIDENPSLSITAAEYFWDTDPGNGSATPILAFDGNFNQAIETALSSSIELPEHGQHTFSIRVQDFDGNWGSVYERKILIIDENPSLSITAAEYFWDTDPGNGSATPILALDGDFNQAIETALSSSIELPGKGQHTFNIRVQDFDGNWGPAYERRILIIRPRGYFADTLEAAFTLNTPYIDEIGETEALLHVAINKPGTIHYALTLPGATPMATEIVDGSSQFISNNFITTDEDVLNDEFLTDLTTNTSYVLHLVIEDEAGRLSEVSEVPFKTNLVDGLVDENSENLGLYLFPNPSSTYVNLNYTSDLYYGEVKIDVYNNFGQSVAHIETEKSNDLLEKQLSLDNLPTGFYQLKITIGDQEMNSSFVHY